jgi:PAS domain S-box-containing protein
VKVSFKRMDVTARTGLVVRSGAAIAVAIGGLGLVGLLLGIPILTNFGPGWISIRPNTAVAVVLLGLSLVPLPAAGARPALRYLQLALALLVALAGLLTLGEYVLGVDLGIDRVLFRETTGGVPGLFPGRMAPTTALNFFLLGTARLAVDADARWADWIVQPFAVLAGLVATLVLVGYLYDVGPLERGTRVVTMAVNSALALLALSAAVLASRPGSWIVRILASGPPGGIIARRVLPATVAILLVLSWLELRAEHAGLWSPDFGNAVQALLAVVLLGALLLWSAGLLDRAAQRRRRTERTQGAIYAIAEATHAAPSLKELYPALHRVVGELMPADNFYIALYDAPTDTISFPYFVDQHDPAPAPKRPGRGLTEYVLRTGQALLATPGVFADLERRGEADQIGAASLDWLGVPLIAGDTTIGVLVLQTYAGGVRYGEEEKRLLQFVSIQAAMAIERKRTEEALREAERRFRTALDGMRLLAVGLDAAGRITYCNDYLLEVTGWRREEVMGTGWFEKFVPPGGASREAFEMGVAAGEVPLHSGNEILTRAGATRRVEWNNTVLRAPEGRVAGFVAIGQDVTERFQLEEQLRQAQKMEAVGQLAGGMAHDLNNLLTTVLASNAMLAAAIPAGAAQREDVELIRQAAQRGADLTRKLLALGRRQPLDFRLLSPGPLLADFTRLAQRVVPEDVRIDLSIAAPEAVIRADEGAVGQILMNLVTNARDAMPTGGTLTLGVACETVDEAKVRARGWGQSGEFVVLEVADTGTGMDEETRRRIFEPFFSTKPVSEHSGLGMSVVYGLMKQHGGFVEVTSTPGRGTAVRVYFPAVSGAPAASTRPEASEIRGGNELVLLVEDEPSVMRATTRVLETFGYAVVGAADGREALEYLRSGQPTPALVISDVVMPGVGGPELLRRMREAGLRVRTLFTSGYTERDMHERETLDPRLPFLSKPWTVTDLLHRIREVLDSPDPLGDAPGGGAAA